MSSAEDLYLNSPIWLQQAAVTLWGAGWYYRRFGGRFRRYVDDFHARDQWTAQQFHQYQEAQLAGIVRAAWGSPYYREVFAAAGIRPEMDPWEVLRRVPLLEKETVRTRSRDLLTLNPPPRQARITKTTGTTGVPLMIYKMRDLDAVSMAVAEARSLHPAGVTHRDRRVMIGHRKVCRMDQNRPPFWRFSLAENMAYLSAYHLAPRFLPAYLALLRRYRPAVVMGFPSALNILAQFALELGDLPPPARCVVTVGELLTAHVRRALEDAFQCRVFDRYGAVEGCVFAAQCEHGRYHLSPEIGIVEILDADGRPASPGTVGELVCTGLHNSLQPLVRYRLGDMARWAENQECPCGRRLPILAGLDGRLSDVLYLADGRRVAGAIVTFSDPLHVKERQIIQEAIGRFVVRVVPGPGFDQQDIDAIQDILRSRLGDVAVRVEPVPAIERGPGGKLREVWCKVPPEETLAVSEHLQR